MPSCLTYCSDIENYMNDRVTHVITNEPWDKNFDDVSSQLTCNHAVNLACMLLDSCCSVVLMVQYVIEAHTAVLD